MAAPCWRVFRWRQVRATSRLGTMRRRLDFPDGSSFETRDNDARRRAAAAATASAAPAGTVLAHGAGLGAAGRRSRRRPFAVYGVPATAGWLARHTPPSVARVHHRHRPWRRSTSWLWSPARLPPAVQQHTISALLGGAWRPGRRIGKRLSSCCFAMRPASAPMPSPCPTALSSSPTRSIPMVKSDDEIEGVFAHEISHVDACPWAAARLSGLAGARRHRLHDRRCQPGRPFRHHPARHPAAIGLFARVRAAGR